MLLRILIWNVSESKTTIDELRESLPELIAAEPLDLERGQPSASASLAFGEDLPEAIGWAQDLVGAEPDVYEEFDTA